MSTTHHDHAPLKRRLEQIEEARAAGDVALVEHLEPLIAEDEADIETLANVEPKHEQLEKAFRDARLDLERARMAIVTNTTDDSDEYLLELKRTELVAEARVHYAQNLVKAHLPSVTRAQQSLDKRSGDRGGVQARSWTKAIFGRYVNDYTKGLSSGLQGALEVAREQVPLIEPAHVVWLAHTERELIRGLPAWSKEHSGFKWTDEDTANLQQAFDARRAGITTRIRELRAQAERSAETAGKLAEALS